MSFPFAVRHSAVRILPPIADRYSFNGSSASSIAKSMATKYPCKLNGPAGMISTNIERPSNTSISFIGSESSAADAFAADACRVPFWKRALDISCLLIALPALIPLSLLIATVIKAGSRGPVLFKQERVGFLGKRFTLFKFRTMIMGADTVIHETHVASLINTNRPMTKLDAHGDFRLIPFGRMMRAAGLDELPQLINILRGEMSIVGPRPCLPIEYDKYLPWQKERFCTPPGLTGLWQVSGKNRTTFNEMINFDIKYARLNSLWFDLQIILKTIPAVLREVKEIHGLNTPTMPSYSHLTDGDTNARAQ